MTCNEVVKNGDEIVELKCTIDPASKGGNSPDGRRVKATMHWVSASESVNTTVRLYDKLFTDENPLGHKGRDFKEFINPDSLKTLVDCKVEPIITGLKPFDSFQFERLGYFVIDTDSTDDNIIINKTTGLRDTWSKVQKKGKK